LYRECRAGAQIIFFRKVGVALVTWPLQFLAVRSAILATAWLLVFHVSTLEIRATWLLGFSRWPVMWKERGCRGILKIQSGRTAGVFKCNSCSLFTSFALLLCLHEFWAQPGRTANAFLSAWHKNTVNIYLRNTYSLPHFTLFIIHRQYRCMHTCSCETPMDQELTVAGDAAATLRYDYVVFDLTPARFQQRKPGYF